MINAQDIWNEFRNNRFVVNFRVREMIEEMKTSPEILRCIFLASSGNYGLSELLVQSYYDSRHDFCKFLLECGVDPNMAKRFVNPEFETLNELFTQYGYTEEKTQEYFVSYKEKIAKYPFI
jgi:hypothetical protein